MDMQKKNFVYKILEACSYRLLVCLHCVRHMTHSLMHEYIQCMVLLVAAI